MRPIAFSLLLIGAVVTPLTAGAAGFGELRLLSGIGQPLHVEIPISGLDAASANLACYSLVRSSTSGLPAIGDASIKLSRQGNQLLLLITGRQPVSEPALALTIRAGCGADFQREYLLLPEPPLLVAATAPPATGEGTAAPIRPGTRTLAARDGETLSDIAQRLRPDWPEGQRRLLAFLAQRNPAWAGGQAIPGGREIVLPRRLQQSKPTNAEAPPTLPSVAKAPANPLTRPSPMAQTETRSDRVVVKPAPAEFLKTPGADTLEEATRISGELNQRIAKMEATVAALQKEVAAIDQAMSLAMEAEALRQQIQQAEAKPATPVTPPAVALPQAVTATTAAILPSAPDSGGLGLSDLLLAGLAGGAAATLALFAKAFWPARRQPLRKAMSNTASAEAQTIIDPVPDIESIDLDGISVHEEAGIELAEIMLSFGRLKGAAVSLADYIQSTSPDSPQAWLMLLDLYRRAGMKSEYQELAPKVGARFNLAVPGWSTNWRGGSLRTLEDYPHIARQLTRDWGHAEALDYLYGLVKDGRNGTRHGFPLEVMEEIVLLIRLLEEGYGLHRAAA